MSAAGEPRAWWSEPGPDICEFCQQSFHVEVGYYCAECDRSVCPVCVLRLREHRTVVCPECTPERDH